jgi:hypothetical protein
MFYVAKIFEAIGVADVGYAIYVGIVQHATMAEEIVLTLIGVGVFFLGRALENKIT